MTPAEQANPSTTTQRQRRESARTTTTTTSCREIDRDTGTHNKLASEAVLHVDARVEQQEEGTEAQEDRRHGGDRDLRHQRALGRDGVTERVQVRASEWEGFARLATAHAPHEWHWCEAPLTYTTKRPRKIRPMMLSRPLSRRKCAAWIGATNGVAVYTQRATRAHMSTRAATIAMACRRRYHCVYVRGCGYAGGRCVRGEASEGRGRSRSRSRSRSAFSRCRLLVRLIFIHRLQQRHQREKEANKRPWGLGIVISGLEHNNNNNNNRNKKNKVASNI